MLQKKIFCFCLVLIVLLKSNAQVNLQTGSATFSLPIFNWQDDKSRLTSMIALSYNSGNGLKVNDLASNAGQGWNLVAGGVITRMQVGEPDDQPAYNGNGSESDITRYPAGFLYATNPAEKGCPNGLTRYPIYQGRNQVYKERNTMAEDKQLDYFSFQFNGKAGMFVLDKVSGNQGISLGDTKMLIRFSRSGSLAAQNIRTTIDSFFIQDVDGLLYKFTKVATAKVLEQNYCDKNLIARTTQPKFNSNKVYNQAGFDNPLFYRPNVVNSWYLAEVEDLLTHRKILFNYNSLTVTSNAGEDISYNDQGNYAIVTHRSSVTKALELSSIVYPDGHTFTVNYGTTTRADLRAEFPISSLDVTYQGRYLSRHLLNTTYFILNRYGTPVSDYQNKVARLCLRSVQKIGVDLKEDTPPYIFDYYLGSNTSDDYVPPPFSYAKDIWGFYNGTNSQGYNNEAIDITTPANWASTAQLKGLCYLRNGVSGIYLNPKPGYAKNGLLKQIIYPTGGTLTYQYDQNTGAINGTSTQVNVGGVHVIQTSSTDGGYSNGCANALTTNYSYVLDAVGNPSSLWGIDMPVNSVTTFNHYEPETKKYKYTFPFGTCYYKYQYPGILSLNQSIDLTTFQKTMAALSPVLNVLSVISTVLDVVNLFVSGGPMAIIAVVMDVIGGLVTIVLTCFTNQSSNKYATYYYNSDMNGISPMPTQYKRVEVIENPGTIGKTVHEFTSSDDYAVWEPTNPDFVAKQRFAPWAYGLPKLMTVYDASGNKIKQTQNYYGYSYAKGIINYCPWINHPGFPCNNTGLQTNLVSCKCYVQKSYSQRNVWWSDPAWYNDPATYQMASNADMNVDFYAMYSGRTLLDSTVERAFRVTDPTKYVATSIAYTYNTTNNYEVNSIATAQSNGDLNFKTIKYSSDYTGGALTTLVQNNIVSLPVASASYVFKGSPVYNYRYLNESVTEFTQLANGDIKPSRILEQRFDQPQTGMSFYTGPGGGIGAYKIPQTFTYDANGNLIGLKDEGNRQVTNLYDYADKYLVASVINADPVNDKVAYSSFETISLGNWSITGGLPVTGAGGITGSQFFVLNSRTLSRTLNTAKPYIVSFWANNSNVVVTGGTLAKSAPTINGFTYYEYNVAQGTASVSLSGSSNIDELRVYPQTARMRTITYDPVIGKTSECDENNRIAYYEYDNLGRLRFIKDEKSNIVKMYEYNNVSAAKQNGCPGTYYNHLASEQFTKSNCGHNQVGITFTYTVAANTYSSTISQEDADHKAELALLTNGQAYANGMTTGAGCLQVYYNVAQSLTVTTESCPEGYAGGSVTYTVPANRYTSTVNQADADQMATDEITANAQAYANDPAHMVCTLSTDPDWEWDNINSYCLSVGGSLPPHLFVYEIDINPNSPTYNQSQWRDVGPDDACPAGNYYNAGQSVNFTKNDCPSGQVGTVFAYVVPPGKYSSTVSQAAADLLATNEVNANGQAYANSHATCVAACNSYKIIVPTSVATNLYIQLTECGTSTPVVRNWNTQFLLDVNDGSSYSSTVCLASSTITFRYGSSGSTVSVPEITVVNMGPCP